MFTEPGSPMAVHFKYLDDGAGVEIIAAGRVTGREIIEANRAIYRRDGALKDLKYQIVDRTECTEYHTTQEEMQQIAAAKLNPRMKIFLVAPTAHQFGMSRMYQMMSEASGLDILIFKSREAANEEIARLFAR